jgi:ABC-2 type transport system ATP-binding protein
MIVETTALTKRYGAHTALDGVDLAVPTGSVYGLVGPNGAGKTTLLALLAGLRKPTAGELRIGVPRQKVALLPDTPQFDPWLTGREVVELAQTLTGADGRSASSRAGADGRSASSRARADGRAAADSGQVLADAGLTDAADRRVGGYSRGMLQRLGLAATTIGAPDLLLLDEPASALDPAGRREVLDLIARMRGHASVILSSHILGDVQEVCDTVGVLRAGRLLFQGPIANLLVGRAVPAYRVQVRPPSEQVAGALRGQPWVTGVEADGPDVLRVTVSSLADAEARLVGALAQAGARVVSLAPLAPDLEDVFLELTS